MKYPPMNLFPWSNPLETKMGYYQVNASQNQSDAWKLCNSNNTFDAAWHTDNDTYDTLTGGYLGVTDTLLSTGGSIMGEWFELACDREFTLRRMSITSPLISNYSQHKGLVTATPRDFTILGRINPEDAFEVVKEFRGLEADADDSLFREPHDLYFEENETRYKTYRLVVEKTNQESIVVENEVKFSYAIVGVWNLYGDAYEALFLHDNNVVHDKTDEIYARMK
jgi:hypothetical protein